MQLIGYKTSSQSDISRLSQFTAIWIGFRLSSGMVLGQSRAAFIEATRVYGQYLGLGMSHMWTPIPMDLFLRTSDNPLGKTDYDPVIFMPESHRLEALWVDRRATSFDVTLSYEHYPFDEQTLDLCVTWKPSQTK